MVWGMSLPQSGGPYGPYGEYEGPAGWRHRLKAFFSEQTPEVRKQLFDYVESDSGNAAHFYPGFVVEKLISEIGTRSGPARPPVTPIEDHEPPRFFQTDKGYETLPSIISLNSRVWAVDKPTKAVIERLEPGIHQFFPIEIRMPRGKVYPILYYVLVFGQYIDSLVPEKCKEGALEVTDSSKKAITGRAFSKAKFGKAHLWRDRAFGEWLACISDELHDEFVKTGLWMPKQYRMIEV